MQIVIDLPDKNYQVTLTKIMLACHGCRITELPKGHGDLIDRNDLLADSYCIDDWGGNEVDIVDVMTVKMADTIIEANKAESEDKT